MTARFADIINDEDGTFAPERAGCLPVFQVIDMMTSGEYDHKTAMKRVKSQGGLVAHLGTNDTREVEKMIADGDEHAKFIYEAMAMNVARFVAMEAPVVKGKVEAIILTGGIAYSEMFTNMLKELVEFLAPVTVYCRRERDAVSGSGRTESAARRRAGQAVLSKLKNK